jgi:hypothetical protein
LPGNFAVQSAWISLISSATKLRCASGDDRNLVG